MDKASAHGAGDYRFESYQDHGHDFLKVGNCSRTHWGLCPQLVSQLSLPKRASDNSEDRGPNTRETTYLGDSSAHARAT